MCNAGQFIEGAPVRYHAQYLFNHYKQSGAAFTDALYQRIVKSEKLKLWEATALKNEFRKLLKAAQSAN